MNNNKEIIKIIFMLASIYFISQFCRASLGVVAINIANDLELNSEEIGRLGGVFFLAFAITQIPLGILLDTYNPIKIIIVMLLLIFVGSILFSIANHFYLLIIARSLQGIGCGVCLMGPLVIITKLTDAKKFSLYSGIVMGVGGLGALIATDPFYYIVAISSWKSAFFYSSFLIIFLILMILIFFPKNFLRKDKSKISFNLNAYKKIIKNKNFLLMLPMSMFGYSSFAFILTLWGSKYLYLVHNINKSNLSFLLMFMALSWSIGSIFFGYIEKKLQQKKNIIIFSSITMCVLLGGLCLNFNYNYYVLLIIFSLIGFFGAFTLVLISHYRVLFNKKIIGKVLTTANLFNFSGVFFVQWLTGFIIFQSKKQYYFSNYSSFSLAFLVVIFFLCVSIYFYYKTDEV